MLANDLPQALHCKANATEALGEGREGDGSKAIEVSFYQNILGSESRIAYHSSFRHLVRIQRRG